MFVRQVCQCLARWSISLLSPKKTFMSGVFRHDQCVAARPGHPFGALFFRRYGGESRTEEMDMRSDAALANRQKFACSYLDDLRATDPEFCAVHDNLVYGEIMDHGTLTDEQRVLVLLCSWTAAQNLEGVEDLVRAALRQHMDPLVMREAIYQCAPYAGFARTAQTLRHFNRALEAEGVALPLEKAGTVTEESRFADGLAAQKAIFGQGIDSMHAKARPEERDVVVNYLSAWCFGDTYTRKPLDLRLRELLTFSVIVSLGGCEPQVKAHAQGNANMGNSKENLIDALAQMLPYIGFPRTLNALACVNEVYG